jgi:hypothetical protein
VFDGEYPPGAIATQGSFDPNDATHTDILIFPPVPGMNAKPLATLHTNIAFTDIASLAFDIDRRLYVLDFHGRIFVFANGATGAAAPVRVINPDGILLETAVTFTHGLAIDRSGTIYIGVETDYDTPGPMEVHVFAPGVSGDVAPERVIGGPHTGVSMPYNLAIDDNQNLLVGNYGGATITVFPPGADGDMAPLRVAARPYGLQAFAIGTGDALWAAPEGTPDWRVQRFDESGNAGILAEISGDKTGFNDLATSPVSMGIDPSGNIVVGTPSGTGLVFATDANGDVAPIGSFVCGDEIAVAPRTCSCST